MWDLKEGQIEGYQVCQDLEHHPPAYEGILPEEIQSFGSDIIEEQKKRT